MLNIILISLFILNYCVLVTEVQDYVIVIVMCILYKGFDVI